MTRRTRGSLLRTTLAASLAVALCSMAGSALAGAHLTIVNATGGNQEESGDPGGTSYAAPAGSLSGPGLPSLGGGWPAGPGIGPDSSFPGSGATGYHAVYLELSAPSLVSFQYMGRGDASLIDKFGVDLNSNGALDPGEIMFQTGTTTACAMLGALVPTCDATNQKTLWLDSGRIAFLYETGRGVTLDNTGNGLGNPDPHGTLPGYMLAVDPYAATGTYQTVGQVVYAGLTDLPGSGDHDFQDLGVRIGVIPEPATLGLLSLAMGGLWLVSRRKAAPSQDGAALVAT